MSKRNAKKSPARGAHAPAALAERAVEALRLTKAAARKHADWEELFNALYRPDGILSQLFTTADERRAFRQTSQARAVEKLLRVAKSPPTDATGGLSPTGKLTVKLPKSLHAALVSEAAEEGTSINQLVIAKLAMQLRRTVEAP